MRLRPWIIGILLAAGVGAGLSWWLGSMLTRPVNHPVMRPHDFEADLVSIPGAGHDIAGWWTDTHHGLPVVLLLHAVRADRDTMVARAQLLQKHGFSTLLIDLQAHGETPGTAITFGKRESADVVAAVAWIKGRAPNRKIGVIGCSLGGASALLAPQPLGVDAVVLEAVYPRLRLAVENRVRLRLGSLTPWVTPLLLWQLTPRLHLRLSDLEPIRSIPYLAAPVLIAAGSDDQHTTLAESQELFAAASVPKELWIVPGAKHQDLLALNAAGYEAHVVQFLVDRLRGPLPHVQRLGKTEVEQLIAEHLATRRPLAFGSYQGVHRCCDLGDPNLVFLPNHWLEAFGDGYVPWQATISYQIGEDGKLVLNRNDWNGNPSVLGSTDLHDAYIYRYGSSLYLERDSEKSPDLSFEPGTRWPFKELSPDSVPSYVTPIHQ